MKKIIDRRIDKKAIILIIYLLIITFICFYEPDNESILFQLDLWMVLTSMACFVVVIVSIFNEKERIPKMSLMTFFVLNVLWFAITIFADGLESLFNFNFVMFEFSLMIFIVVSIIKRNRIASDLGKLLLVFYALHVVIRDIIFNSDIIVFIIELIFFGIIGLIFGLPIYLLINKRIKNANIIAENEQLNDLDSTINENETYSNGLDNIID
jgi:hypothetical protein